MSKTPHHWKVGKAETEKAHKGRLLEGLPVIDADKDMVIRISRRDILGSKKVDAANCAAARAIRRECGSQARVFLTRTYVKVGKAWQRFKTPASISREIVAFDRGAEFMPGEYALNAPSQAQRLDYKRLSGKKNKSPRKTFHRHVTTSVRQMHPDEAQGRR